MDLWEVSSTVHIHPSWSAGPGCPSSLAPEPLLPLASWSPSSPSGLPPLHQLPEASAYSTASILALPWLKFCSDSCCLEKRNRTQPDVNGSLGTSQSDPTYPSPATSLLHPVLLPQEQILHLSCMHFPPPRLCLCWHLHLGCPPATSLSCLSSKAQLECHLLQEVLAEYLSEIRPFLSFCMTCVSTRVPTFILPCVMAFCFNLLSPPKWELPHGQDCM